MTYRVGHHSTSDDSSRYREADEMALWRSRDPVDRLRYYLESQGLWDNDQEAALRHDKRTECTGAVREAAAMARHPAEEMFTDGAVSAAGAKMARQSLICFLARTTVYLGDSEPGV